MVLDTHSLELRKQDGRTANEYTSKLRLWERYIQHPYS
jgi:hypothetical protein